MHSAERGNLLKRGQPWQRVKVPVYFEIPIQIPGFCPDYPVPGTTLGGFVGFNPLK